MFERGWQRTNLLGILLTYSYLDQKLYSVTTKSLNFSFQNRAENLMKNYNLYKQQRILSCADGPGMRIYKKPLVLTNVGWCDQKTAPDAQHTLPGPIVAIQTQITSAWFGRDSVFSTLQRDVVNDA